MSETKPIEPVEQMGHLIIQWYNTVVAKLNHTLDIPDDVVVAITVDGINTKGEPVKVDKDLDPDQRTAFLAGIAFAIECVGDLPFGTTPDEPTTH